MYVDVPTKVSATEFINSPETPKSHTLISPAELHSIFDGLMSADKLSSEIGPEQRRMYTSVDDAMHIV